MPYAVRPNLTIVKILNFQNLKLILNCIIHYLFYVTAFSATFKLLTTQLRFLPLICTNMSKNAFYLPVRCRVFTLCKTAPTSAALDFSTTKLGRIIQGWKIVESEWRVKRRKWTP